MAYTPHNFFDPPKDQAFPTPQAHQDEAAELAHAYRSPALAFVAIALALLGFVAFYLGSSLLLVRLAFAVATIVISILAWRLARHQHKPTGVAVAALGLSVFAAAVELAMLL